MGNEEIKPAISDIIYNKDNSDFQVYTGLKWIIIGVNSKPCVMCKVKYYKHNTSIDHPFFGNNLEYLEWKNIQNEQFTR